MYFLPLLLTIAYFHNCNIVVLQTFLFYISITIGNFIQRHSFYYNLHPNTVEMHTAKYFWIVFTIKLKRNNLRHELKKYMVQIRKKGR